MIIWNLTDTANDNAYIFYIKHATGIPSKLNDYKVWKVLVLICMGIIYCNKKPTSVWKITNFIWLLSL